VTVSVDPLVGAEMLAPPRFWDGGGARIGAVIETLSTPRKRWMRLPIPAFLIRHPTAGSILVDTAFHASVATEPHVNLGRAMASVYKINMHVEQAVPAQLQKRGIATQDVGLVLMTHLHYDHASGISQFPEATFVVDRGEWAAASHGGFTDGYRRRLTNHPFDWRTVDFTSDHTSPYAPFANTIDLLGDGSIRLVRTPGHTKGHMSVLCRLAGGELLITGDAAYSRRTIAERLIPIFLSGDRRDYLRSLEEIRRYIEDNPDAVILCGHDPWERAALERSYS
jgi:N-acyl homoserine lactone hydrolase